MKHLIETATIISAAAAIALAGRPLTPPYRPTAAAVITPAPAAATISAGASLGTSTSQIGGDLSPSHQKVEHDAQAPAGAASPAGAFISHEEAGDFGHSVPPETLEKQPGPAKNSAISMATGPAGFCPCGPNCPCKLTAALAQPPAPAVPVNAPAALPVAAAYMPVYPTYRPTFTGYYQGSCGPGGCGPVRGFFGRRR